MTPTISRTLHLLCCSPRRGLLVRTLLFLCLNLWFVPSCVHGNLREHKLFVHTRLLAHLGVLLRRRALVTHAARFSHAPHLHFSGMFFWVVLIHAFARSPSHSFQQTSTRLAIAFAAW